jgi:hypothetical protein
MLKVYTTRKCVSKGIAAHWSVRRQLIETNCDHESLAISDVIVTHSSACIHGLDYLARIVEGYAKADIVTQIRMPRRPYFRICCCSKSF